jgi:hypothetical protein
VVRHKDAVLNIVNLKLIWRRLLNIGCRHLCLCFVYWWWFGSFFKNTSAFESLLSEYIVLYMILVILVPSNSRDIHFLF